MPDAASDGEEEEEEISSDEEVEDEEEQKQPTQAYLSLMKSLAENAPNKAKRRKLDHTSSTEDAPNPKEPEPVPEAKTEEAEDSEPQDAGDDPDFVDDAEGEEDQAEDGAIEDLFDEDDDLDAEDPFEVHFDSPKDDVVQPRVKSIQEGGWKTQRAIQNSMRIQLSTPNTEQPLPGPMTGIADLKLKKKLKESLASKREKFDAVEQTIAPLLFNYQDLLYCDRTVSGGQSVRRMACLHALNHIFK